MSTQPKPRPKTLSAAFVKAAREPGRYGDGRGGYGLSLLVKPTSTGRLSKTWSQRLKINGRPIMLGLGAYPVVTLGEARATALENRRALAQGKDPRRGPVPTFAEAAEAVIDLHRPTWRDGARSAEVWRSSLERLAYPILGRVTVDKITTGEIRAVIEPLWNTKHETATRLLGRIRAVMGWAVAQGHRTDDPTTAATADLPRNGATVKHHAALPHGQVAGALATVAASGARPATKLAFRLLVLTAARSGEVRGATWAEVDLTAAVWTVPGTRTKTGKPLRVPLPTAALAVLTAAEALGGRVGLCFPSVTGRPMTPEGLSKLCKDLSIGAVPHGFRSSFRSWCADTGVPREVAEAALGHIVTGVEGAYQRSDLLDRRRQLMHEWATYVAR